MAVDDIRGEEITQLLNAVKQRVRARYETASVAVGAGREPLRIALPDLMPLLHARDAAQAKVAAIGSVNPRPGGPLNQLVQAWKRAVSRSLSWFVRDQVIFNRQVMTCVETTIEVFSEVTASLNVLAGYMATETERQAREITQRLDAIDREAAELRDIRVHWEMWRAHWEKALAMNELQFSRNVADLQTGFSYRSTTMEADFRDAVRRQHDDFQSKLDSNTLEVQQRLWADLEKMRVEYDRLIHNELRVLRQRLLAGRPESALIPSVIPTLSTAAPAQPALGFDYARFADRFRGSEAFVRANQQFYLALFRDAGRVLDLGCGRGEFLELLRENGITGRGVESGVESVNYCCAKGLDVEKADLFSYLESLPEAAEDVIFCSQVVEHLDPARLPFLVRLCAGRLRRGGLLAIETPNPESLAIFATHFYLDPTHTRPVPPSLLAFHMEENGMGGVEIHRFAPAAESFPEIRALPADFVERFFGGMDYAIVGRKL